MNPRWPIAVRAAISTAVPVVAGWAAGNVGSGLIATIGAFTLRFGGDRPYLNRGVQLAVVSVALAAAVAVGCWAAEVPWLGVPVVSAVAVAAVWLCNALAVGPPGAYVFALACAAGVGVSAQHLAPWQTGALVLSGGAVAWLVQMAGALRGRRRPERAALSAAGAAVASYVEAVGSPSELAARHRAATALHQAWNALISFQLVEHSDGTLQRLRAVNHALHVVFTDSMSTATVGGVPPPDAAATARRIASLELAPETVATRDIGRVPLGPASSADRSRTRRRGADRLSGTWVGLALAASILWLHPQGLWLALILAVPQLVIEMLVVRHYGLASVFITAAALTIATGTRHVDIVELLLARGSDTLVGCAVGVTVFLVTSRFQESTRLVDSIADAPDAAAATSAHLAVDTSTLAARTARRDLQLAAIDLRDAADAAEAVSGPPRATGQRLEPAVLVTEHIAYGTITACWQMEKHESGPLLGPADALAYRRQLHGLAVALRTAVPPPDLDACPDFLAADVTALCAALRQNSR
jgi:uncharacterized membrane protein YccC